jgi:hypothetical protein
MSNEDFISIKALSEKLGMDRSHARRFVLKLGIIPQKRRTHDSANQLTLTVTSTEAEKILEARRSLGFSEDRNIVESETGVFYVIQLVPELDPKRIKLGYANDLADRLTQHRTSAPTAKVAASWPCKRSWETTVMDCLRVIGCKHILNEVFECEDLDALIAQGARLAALLPDPKATIEFSEHSPYKQ